MDYILADKVVMPEAMRHLLAEKVYDLPCFIPMEMPTQVDPIRPPKAIERGYVTFGMFNRSVKITREALRIWGRILTAVPKSRLLVKNIQCNDDVLRNLITGEFASCGVASDRIEFRGGTRQLPHIAAIADVDVFLDTFPHAGGVTTWECLYRGVPVVTKIGETPPARLSAAILASIGISEWVAGTLDEYVDIAVTLANDVDYLTRMRSELPKMIAASPSGDHGIYTRAVEDGYRAMWIAL